VILLSECGTVGDITVRVRYRERYYCQSVVQWAILLPEWGTVGDITVSVWYSRRYCCHCVLHWAILLPEWGTVRDITVSVWYSGRYYCQCVILGYITARMRYITRYYCQCVVQWAILLSECGTVGDITSKVLLVSLKHCVGVQNKNESTSGRQTLQHAPTSTQRRIFHNPESPVLPIYTIRFTVKTHTFCPHSVFMCFVWIWELTAIISLYSINWLFL